jgi:hypothetical protein
MWKLLQKNDKLIKGINVYKYLGIIEDKQGKPMRESFERLRVEFT